jgi:ribonucleotide reductase beta subunit family protein with ferritin-like domain
MDDILQFIALETKEISKGIQTTLTFTPAAIDLIVQSYEIDYKQFEDLMEATASQNGDMWDSLEDEEKQMISDSLRDQIICESFVTNQMGIDCEEMVSSSNSKGEIHMVVITKEETGYL